MYKIGEFSKLARVSVKTLRYYDEVGLFEPSRVEASTGYRYYAASQLAELHRILTYKDMGFSLEQISQLLKEDLTSAQVYALLRLRQAELREQIEADRGRLERIENRLRWIEQEGRMSNIDVVIKRIEALKVASLRDVVPNYSDQGPLWGELTGYLAQHNHPLMGPCLTVYYDDEYTESNVDLEVCEPVNRELPKQGRIQVRELPRVEQMACAIHKGSYATLDTTYTALTRWIAAHGLRICGPNREVYLVDQEHNENPEEWVTEVQFPVCPA